MSEQMLATVFGRHGVYVSQPGEFMRGEEGRGKGPVVVLRNIEVEFDHCDCEDHKGSLGCPSPTIPSLGRVIVLVKMGLRDLTWDDATQAWKSTVQK